MNYKFFVVASLIASSYFFVSCKDDDASPINSHGRDIASFVSSLPMPSTEEVKLGKEEIDKVVERKKNTLTTITTYQMGVNFDDQFLLDPSTDVIYPGSLIDGASVLSGDYRAIDLPRNPITISTSFNNLSGDVYKEVENPNLANVRQAVKELMFDNEVNGATTAQMQFEITEVSSKEDLALKLNTSAKFGKKASIEDNFSFDKSKYNKSFLVKFQQIFYTIDVNSISVENFFSPSVTVEDLKSKIPGEYAPCYVSTVKYGRIAYFSVETSSSSSNFENELNGAIKYMMVEGKIDSKITSSEVFNSSTIKGTILGGSSDEAIKSISGMEGMLSYLNSTKSASFSKENPPAPISYTLRNLSDGSVFSVNASTTYQIKNTVNYKGGVRLVSILAITGEQSDNSPTDFFGDIYVYFSDDYQKDYPIFSLKRENYVEIEKGQTFQTKQTSANEGTINGKKYYSSEVPLNFDNYKYLCFYFNTCYDRDYQSADDAYWTDKNGESKVFNKSNGSTLFNDMIQAFDNGQKSYTIIKDLYKCYENNKPINNPDVIRVTFEVSLQPED